MSFLHLLHRLYKAHRTRQAAYILFPSETWIKTEPHIWVAASRLIERTKEPEKWNREMSQVKILTNRGSTAYFLPERTKSGENATLCADLVLDGVIMELKTVSGSRVTLGTEFRFAYKQGAVLVADHPGIQAHSVFIRLKSGLSAKSVQAKIAGELKGRQTPGSFICYFETSGMLYSWTYDELRAIIRRGTSAQASPREAGLG